MIAWVGKIGKSGKLLSRLHAVDVVHAWYGTLAVCGLWIHKVDKNPPRDHPQCKKCVRLIENQNKRWFR